MAGEWKTVPLSTVATVRSGKRLPLGQTLTSQRTPHPYVRLVDIDGNRIRKENMQYLEPSTQRAISRYIVRGGDVCLAIVGHTIGLVFQVEDQWDGANLTENAARLTDFRGADPTFVFSYLRSQLGQDLIKSRTVGSAQGKLPLYAIASFPIPLPPLTEQKAIAAVLGALDDKIELNRRMNVTLEAMARALFQSWFVDFDPVRAKLDGRQPFGLDPANAALFPDSFQASEVGHIPKGWSVGRVVEASDFSRSSINPGGFPGETFDHYSLPAFDEGQTPKPELGSQIMSNKLVVTRDSVLLSKLNPHIPRIWLPDLHATRRSVCSTEFIVAKPRLGYSREFLFSLFTSAAFSSTYCTLVTGTTGSHQRIRPDSVLDMKTVIPPPPLVEAFTAVAKPMFGQINRNIDQSRTLATLRDTLLPKLLSGELSTALLPN